MKDSVRKLVPAHYGLKSGGKAEVMKANVKRVESLLAGSAFHFKVAALDDHKQEVNIIPTDCEGCPSLL